MQSRILRQLEKLRSPICLNLDPLYARDQKGNTTVEDEDVYLFLTKIIDATTPYVCAYILKTYLFHQLKNGYDVQNRIIGYIKNTAPDTAVLIEIPIEDNNYDPHVLVENILKGIGVDGIFINPNIVDRVADDVPSFTDKNIIFRLTTPAPNIVLADYIGEKPSWKRVLETIRNKEISYNILIGISKVDLEEITLCGLIPKSASFVIEPLPIVEDLIYDYKQLLKLESGGIVLVAPPSEMLYHCDKGCDWYTEFKNKIHLLWGQLKMANDSYDAEDSLIIRCLQEKDYPNIYDIFQKGYSGFPWFDNFSHEDAEAELNRAIIRKGFKGIVAVQSSKILGVNIWETPDLETIESERGPELGAFIRSNLVEDMELIWEREIAVDPAYHGQGLATILRNEFRKYVSIFSPVLVLNKMRDDNIPTIRTAEKIGFKRTGIREEDKKISGLFHEYWYFNIT